MAPEPFEYMLSAMKSRYGHYAEAWERANKEFGPQWRNEFNELVTTFLGEDPSLWLPAVDGYAAFSTDALRAQVYFEKHRTYRSTSYSEANENYYQNPAFMLHRYLPGMLLAHFVWPHHQRLLQHYRALMTSRTSVRTFAEVGTGCGLYSLETLSRIPASTGIGFDISAHSLRFTEALVSSHKLSARYRTEIRDILVRESEQFDLVICQEVLEHLEDPSRFVAALFAMTKPGGEAYISAAINAGHVDHIFLYRSPNDVARHIAQAGFDIIDVHTELAYTHKPLEITPAVSGFLCKRRK